MPNFIALGIFLIFGTKFFSNKGTDICFNVEFVLLGRKFGFSWWLLGGYCLLPGGYCSLLLVPTFTMNVKFLLLIPHSNAYCESIFSTVKKICTNERHNLGKDPTDG